MIWPILKMVLTLGLLCTLLFLTLRFLKRSGVVKKGLSGDAGIQVLATQAIAPQKYISLVEIGGEILALGISESQITFLTKIENKDWVEKRLASPSTKAEPLSFMNALHLSSFKYKGLKMAFLRKENER